MNLLTFYKYLICHEDAKALSNTKSLRIFSPLCLRSNNLLNRRILFKQIDLCAFHLFSIISPACCIKPVNSS